MASNNYPFQTVVMVSQQDGNDVDALAKARGTSRAALLRTFISTGLRTARASGELEEAREFVKQTEREAARAARLAAKRAARASAGAE